MKALLKNYRQSPRKTRVVANMVRGKSVADALTLLEFLPKRAGVALAKVIRGAAANAEHNFKADLESLVIREVRVDEGITIKRMQPASRGRAHPIHKRTSRILITLGAASPKAKKTRRTSYKKRAVLAPQA